MGASLVRVEAGTATIYGSGSFPSFLGVGNLSSIVITRTAQTPPGDPVRVDLTSALGQLRGSCTITVQGGATALVGGGILNAGVGNALRLDGGRLIISSSLLNASAGSVITVGPNAGELRIERQGFGVRFDLPVNFVDKYGRTTSRIPRNFTMDFPDTDSVRAVYDPAKNQTVIGDGVGGGGWLSFGRSTILRGDPFNLQRYGSAQSDFWGTVNGYVYDFTNDNGHDDGAGGVITCFLSGSLIRTTRGMVAVEELVVGDEIAVFSPGGRQTGWQPVKWVGQGRTTVRSGQPDDEAGWPVHIRPNALADGVPSRDMLVTAEHCLLVDGHFVPARMLVNGVSIFYDRSLPAYDYWHVEIEPHGIIEADGALTESYLDTGNRRGFIAQLGQWAAGVSRSWERDGAAPLGVKRDLVEPAYRLFQRRAGIVGARPAQGRALVDDPALTVLVPSGVALPLVRQTGRRYLFRFSAPCKEVILLSRVSRPCDVIGPFVDDRRWLGVLVGRVLLFREAGGLEPVTGFLSAPRQEGWDVQELTPCRWTNGHARLVLPEEAEGEPLFLSIELLGGGPYLSQPGPVGRGRVRLSSRDGRAA